MKEYDYSETDEDNDDWDDAEEEWYESMQPTETLSKKDVGIIEKNVLTLMENSLRDKIRHYKKEGYPYEDYPEEDVTCNMTVMDRISLLEKRMDMLLSWMKSKYGYKGKSPYYQYPDTEKKLSLRDSVIEKLSKKPHWDSISPEQREKETREEMLRLALGTRGQENLTMEKSILSEGTLVDDVDTAFKEKKCLWCDWKDPTMSWASFLEHLDKIHTETATKFYFLIQTLQPERWTRRAKASLSKEEETTEKSLRHQILESREVRLRREKK